MVAIAGLLLLQLIVAIGKFLWELLKKKTDDAQQQMSRIELALQQNTQAVRDIRIQMGVLDRDLSKVHDLSKDIQNISSAVKYMAGKRWPAIRKAVADDTPPK